MRQRGHGELQRTGRAESVTEYGLAGRHRKVPGVRSEDLPQRRRLRTIIVRRPGAVRVDVVDLIGISSRVRERGAHGPGSAVRIGCRDIEGIGAHAKSLDFRVDPRSTRECMRALLHQEDGSPFAEHQP